MQFTQVAQPLVAGRGNGAVDGSAMADAEAAHEIEHLRRALVNRTVIGQAIGILMERFKVTSDEAFADLKTTSQGLNVKLAEIARDLSDSGEWPPPAPG